MGETLKWLYIPHILSNEIKYVLEDQVVSTHQGDGYQKFL